MVSKYRNAREGSHEPMNTNPMPDRDTASAVPSRGDIPSHVVDGLPMPVVVTRMTDDTVVRVNPEYEHAYGFSGPEMAGRDFRRMHFVPEDRDAALAAFADGHLESVEVRLRHRNGECCWAQSDISRFDLEGQPVLLTTLYDITDQKTAEISLRQSEKLATLGTLAAGLAHELNNPASATQRAAVQLEETFPALQSSQARLRTLGLSEEVAAVLRELDGQAREVASFPRDLNPLERSDREEEVELWLDESQAEDPWDLAPGLVELGYGSDSLDALAQRVGAEAALVLMAWQTRVHGVYRLLGEIRHGSARLVEIVGAMKAYAYLGDAPLQTVDVNEGLRNTLVILRTKLKAGISVRQELDASLPRIQAYGSDLNQVWTNLLDNAVDAMEGRGAIVVRSALRDGGIVVEIEDDGPGIPPEIQPRIFDAFFTTKPPGKGTGLGLNTSYKIVVQKHGGAIRVESHPGSTRFIVELPMTPPASAGGGDTPFTSDQEE
jgi:PAS domain S-box-containing protein